jgi:hypothetical protein
MIKKGRIKMEKRIMIKTGRIKMEKKRRETKI